MPSLALTAAWLLTMDDLIHKEGTQGVCEDTYVYMCVCVTCIRSH